MIEPTALSGRHLFDLDVEIMSINDILDMYGIWRLALEYSLCFQFSWFASIGWPQ